MADTTTSSADVGDLAPVTRLSGNGNVYAVTMTNCAFSGDLTRGATSIDCPPDARPSPIYGAIVFDGEEQEWEYNASKSSIKNVKSGLYVTVNGEASPGARVIEKTKGSKWIVETDGKGRKSINLSGTELYWYLNESDNYSYITLEKKDGGLKWKWDWADV